MCQLASPSTGSGRTDLFSVSLNRNVCHVPFNRITENLVREGLRSLGYYDSASTTRVEEQKSEIDQVKRLLKTASKTGGGGGGSPEFIISDVSSADFLIVIECKADTKYHESPELDIPPDLVNAYVVLKKFTYPSGLYGGHSATFYIPEGVPQPTGTYGHSKVYDFNSITLECRGDSACGQAIMGGKIGTGSTQQTTTFNGGSGMAVTYKQSLADESKSRSRGDERGAIPKSVGSRPATMELDEKQNPTNLPSVPFARGTSALSQNAELHAVGVYEGPRHFGGMPVDDPSSSTVSVRVHAKKIPVVLALYSYESVLWNIIADDGVVIKEIILSSYNASKVSGIDDKVVKVTRQDLGLAYDNSTAKSVAPNLMAYTGLDVWTFQISYKGTEFSVGP